MKWHEEEKESKGSRRTCCCVSIVILPSSWRMRILLERICIRGTIVPLLIRLETRPRPPVCIVRKHENRYSQWNLVTVVPLAWSRLCYLREHTHSHCQTTNCPGSKLGSLTTDWLHDLPLALMACCGHLLLPLPLTSPRDSCSSSVSIFPVSSSTIRSNPCSPLRFSSLAFDLAFATFNPDFFQNFSEFLYPTSVSLLRKW